MGELASSHESGGPGSFVCHADAAPLEKKVPAWTLDMAVRLLKSALPRPTLTVADAIGIREYSLRRNRIAKQSHYKRWKKRHKKVRFKVLL
jgi:hypothetical protein